MRRSLSITGPHRVNGCAEQLLLRNQLDSEGKSKKDILRCLKRAIAREAFHLIAHPQPMQSAADLRPTRRRLGLTITDVANALESGIAKISRIERGHIRDTRFLHEYRDWLTSQQPLRTAA